MYLTRAPCTNTQQIQCRSSVSGYGCSGTTVGDFRNSRNTQARNRDSFVGQNLLRIMGNFSMSGSPGRTIIVGNSTKNATVAAYEQVWMLGFVYVCMYRVYVVCRYTFTLVHICMRMRRHSCMHTYMYAYMHT